MGPQQLLADAFRSVQLDNSAAAKKRAEEPSSRFDDYLDEARSTAGTSASDEPEESAPTEDDREPDSEETRDASDQSESGENADANVDASAETAARTQAVEAFAPVVQTGGEAEAAEASSEANAAQVKTNSDGVAREDTPDVAARSAAPVAKTDAETAAAVAAKRDVAKAEAAPESTTRNVEAESGRQTRVTQQQKTDSESGGRQDASESGRGQQGDGRELNANQKTDAPERQTRQSDGQVREQASNERTAAGGETLHQRKVKEWIEGRREGKVEQAETKPEATTSRKNASSVSERLAKLEDAESSRLDKLPTLKSGQGDGPAAALAKFLLSGSGKDSMSSQEAAPASQPVAAVNTSGVNASRGSSAVVGDLLASRVEGGNPIDNAARVMASSNGNGRYQVTMQLDPPDLGQLKVQIRMQQQGMTLNVDVQSRSVAQLMESRMSDLREALATHGIRVDRTDIVVRSPDTAETGLQQQREHGQPSSQGSDMAGSHHGGGDATGGGRTAGSDREADHGAWTGAGEQDVDGAAATVGGEMTEELMLATESSVDLVA